MMKHFEDRQVIEALEGMDVVKLGEESIQLWHIKVVPYVILADGKNKIRERIEGLVPAADLAVAIRKFKSDLQAEADADKGSYYPAKRNFRWTLNGRNINHSHMTNHWAHAKDGIDHDYIRGLDWYECNTLHDHAHEHRVDWRYAVHK